MASHLEYSSTASANRELTEMENTNSMGTYAQCLVSICHNLEAFMNLCGEKMQADDELKSLWNQSEILSMGKKITILTGREVR